MTTNEEIEDKVALRESLLDYSKISQALEEGQLFLLGPDKKKTVIPDSVLKVIKDAVTELNRGRSVEVVNSDLHITTQEAADYIGMSRPTFVQLLKDGKLPYTQAGDGKHRRIKISDLVEYQKRVVAERPGHLANMVRIGQEMMADPNYVEPSMEEIIRIIKEIRREHGDEKSAESNT
jgi:hypothetical protein